MLSWRINRTLDGLVGRIERATVLDPVTDRAASIIGRPLAASAPLRNALSGTAAGHPLHPVLVMLPIGAWLGAGYLDLTGGRQAQDAATRLVGAGVAAAVPAALTGANDWSYTEGAERRVGFVHAVGNYLAVGLYAGSWLARRRERRSLGTSLAAAGAVPVGVTGWLGGHLSYARGVGVDTTAFQVASGEWTDVLPEADLADEQPTLVHDGGVPVLLVRTSGRLHAIADRCSHRGGALHEGSFADGCIVCPLHASSFRVADGQLLSGPATRSQPAYEVRTRYGSIQLRRADEPGSLRSNPVS